MTGLPEPRGLSAVLWVLTFGSIWTMLGFLYGLAPMHVLGVWLLLPSLLAIFAAWLWAWRAGHEELHLALLVGFWGGLWGVLGYDLIRLPLHFMGLNPFAPIRSYGMFVTNAPHATLGSDWAGALYHVSNGLTFGWMYALLMRRRSFAWAVLWGLVLETLAVVTVYGAVYQIRGNWPVLGVAYFAHLYYGLPLGWACADPERLRRAVTGPRRAAIAGATALALAAVAAVLAMAWERPWRGPDLPAATVQVGPDALYYGWTRSQDGRIRLSSAADHPVTVEVRGVLDPTAITPGEAIEVTLPPGLYQVRAPEEPWRSAFLSSERDGVPRGERTSPPPRR